MVGHTSFVQSPLFAFVVCAVELLASQLCSPMQVDLATHIMMMLLCVKT